MFTPRGERQRRKAIHVGMHLPALASFFRGSFPSAPGELRRAASAWDLKHPGMIQLDGDTASGRAHMSEVGRGHDGRGGLNYAIYHDRYQRTGDG
ncbi:nuclear transport factor 2 family protein [Streptomyces sp. NPDC055681]